LHNSFNKWDELRDSTKLKIAAQSVKAGIEHTLSLVSAADKNTEREKTSWENSVRVVRMTTAELGIDPNRLELMPPDQRPDFILQKRVEKLRQIAGKEGVKGQAEEKQP